MTIANITKVMGWLNLADTDYLAARHLLLGHFLVQGGMLANTAIEKYFKMILEIRGIDLKNLRKGLKSGHEITGYYSHVKQDTNLSLNEDFLSFLEKAYKLRYLDNLETGFNIFLNQSKMLACLDRTVYEIRSGIILQGPKTSSRFDGWIENANPTLINLNHAFGTIAREDLFKVPSFCHEIRILSNQVPLEAEYLALVADDDIFNIEALKPN